MTDVTASRDENAPVQAVLWMFATGMAFVGVTVVIKFMDGRLPPFESAFLRYLLGLVFVVPMLRSFTSTTWTPRLHLVLGARGIVHAIGVGGWFYAMSRIPLAEVTAIGYLTPIFISIGAVFVLGEKMALRRTLAIVAAFVGSLIILRPGLREITPGHLAMLATALTFGVSHLLAKLGVRDSSPGVVVAMLSIWVPIALLPFAIATWVSPSGADLALLFLVACLATAGHYTMMLAFAAAPVSVSQPVTFLQLVWATLIGALMFGEAIDIWVVAGGVLILTSITYISWREAVLKKRSITPPAPAIDH